MAGDTAPAVSPGQARQAAIEKMRLWHNEHDATFPTHTERLTFVARAVTQLHRQRQGYADGQWGIEGDETDAGWGDAPVHQLSPPSSRCQNSTTGRKPGAPQLRDEKLPRHKVAAAVRNRDIWLKDSQSRRRDDDRGAPIMQLEGKLMRHDDDRGAHIIQLDGKLMPALPRSARACCWDDPQPNRLKCTVLACMESAMGSEDDEGTESDAEAAMADAAWTCAAASSDVDTEDGTNFIDAAAGTILSSPRSRLAGCDAAVPTVATSAAASSVGKDDPTMPPRSPRSDPGSVLNGAVAPSPAVRSPLPSKPSRRRSGALPSVPLEPTQSRSRRSGDGSSFPFAPMRSRGRRSGDCAAFGLDQEAGVMVADYAWVVVDGDAAHKAYRGCGGTSGCAELAPFGGYSPAPTEPILEMFSF